MPIRVRTAADLAACVAVLRRMHEASGYPPVWPGDPRGHPAIALYEQAGWQLACAQPAW